MTAPVWTTEALTAVSDRLGAVTERNSGSLKDAYVDPDTDGRIEHALEGLHLPRKS